MMVNNWALSIQLNVRFEFSATSSSEWNCCSIFQNFQKEANFARYTQIFRNFSPKFFFPFIFAPGISRIFGRMVRISDIQQIPESFLGNFCTIFLCFQILESFSSMESAQSFHYFSRRLHVHPSSQSGNTLLIITRLLLQRQVKFTILWQLFSWPRNTGKYSTLRPVLFFLEDWMLLLLTHSCKQVF